MARRMVTLQLSAFGHWAIVLISLWALVGTSDADAQAVSLGCLDIYIGERIGRYDLTGGTYTEFSTLESELQRSESRSPDGKHIVYLGSNGELVIAAPDRKPEQTVEVPDPLTVTDFPQWSPDSAHLSVMMISPADLDRRLVILSVTGKIEQLYTLPDTALYGALMSWSPDSRYIAVTVNEESGNPQGYFEASIDLYRIDGTVFPQVADHAVGYVECREFCDSHDTFEWSGDGHTMFYVQFTSGSKEQFNALAYRIDERQTVKLAQALSDFPVYNKDASYALIQGKDADRTYAALLNTMTAQTTVLDRRNSPVDLKWLGDQALARWENYLVWTNADGTGKHQLDVSPTQLVNGPSTVSSSSTGQYDWSRDGRWLVLQAVSETGDHDYIWAIDLGSGKARKIAGVRAPYVWSDGRFISPDSRFAVLRDDGLYLLSLPDGILLKARLDQDILFAIQELVWSPDNTLLAVLPASSRNLYLIRRDGTQIRHYSNFPYLGDPALYSAKWSDCR